MKTNKLKTGHFYDTKALEFVGWSKKGVVGYNCWDYFGVGNQYLGPDMDNVEPLFSNGDDAEILICEDCGVGLIGKYKSYTTTEAMSKKGHGWCPGCYALRTAIATCKPITRLLRAQQDRRLKVMKYGYTLKP
jgi:hypothetical protein